MKMLLHTCCGPCSVYVVEKIRNEGFEVEGYFYNPNIHPYEEFEKRKKTMQFYSTKIGLSTTYNLEYLQNAWEKFKGVTNERCNMCYTIRLENTALYAKNNGYDSFTTTLLVSPYQNHDYIIETSKSIAKKYDLNFYYYDFRDGFRYGQKKAKEMKLYRQKYCGCVFSLNE